MDLSKMSDAELEAIASGKKRPAPDLSSMSDEQLEQLAKGGSPKTSWLESLFRGGVQGATLNHADEIAGASESMPAVDRPAGFNPALTWADDIEPAKDYKTARDESRANFNKAQLDHPIVYGAGELGGTVATSFLPIGEAGQAAKAFTRSQKAAQYLKGIGKLAAVGGGLGAASASGLSEADNLNDLGKDILGGAKTGVIVGGITGAATPLVEAGVQKAGQKLKDFAEERAFKAAGGIKKDFARVNKKGAERVNQIGRELLDEGIVSPLSSVDDIAERLDAKVGEKTAALNRHIDEADKVLSQGGGTLDQMLAGEEARFNPEKVAEQLKAELKARYPGVPESKLQPAMDEIDTWLAGRADEMSARELQDAKVSMNRFLKDSDFYRNPNTGISREGMTSVRRALKEGIEGKGNAAAQILGDATGEIQNTNRSLGNLLEAQGANADAQAREAGNRFFGLTDHIVGTGLGAAEGAREGGWEGALGGAALGFVGNKLARKYGAPMSAVAADKMSRLLLQSPRFQQMAQSNPGAFRALVTKFSERMPIPKAAYNPKQQHSEEQARQSFLDGN